MKRSLPVRQIHAYYTLLFALAALLNPLAYAVFLRRAGAAFLPWYFITMNITAVILYMAVLKRSSFSNRKGHSAVLLCYCGYLATVPLQFASEGFLIIFIFQLVTQLFVMVSLTTFNGYLAETLTLREAKSVLPPMFAWSSVGAILAGFSLQYLLGTFGTRTLLFLLAASGGGLYWLFRNLAAQIGGGIVERENSALGGLGAILKQARQIPLVLIIAMMLFIISFQENMVDFVFYRLLAQEFPNETDLAAFSGIFRSTQMLSIVLLQFFILSRIMAWLSLSGVLSLMPFVMLLATAAPLLVIHLLTICGMKLLNEVMLKGFHRPAYSMMLNAFGSIRSRLNFLFELSGAGGKAFAGVVLLLVTPWLETRGLLLIIIAGFFLQALIVRHLEPAYIDVLRGSLSELTPEDDEVNLEFLEYTPIRRVEDSLNQLIHSSDAVTRRKGFLAISHFPDGASALADGLLRETDNHNIATLVTLLAERSPARFRLLFPRFDTFSDPRVRSSILEGVTRSKNPELQREGIQLARRAMNDSHHRVRAVAAVTLLKTEIETVQLEHSLDLVKTMLRSEEILDRAAMVACLAELGHPVFAPALSERLNDSAPEVRRLAVRGLVARGGPTEREQLLQRLHCEENLDVRRQIQEGLERQQDDTFHLVVDVLEGCGEAERQELLRGLGGLSDGSRSRLLLRTLQCRPDDRKCLLRLYGLINSPALLKLLEQCLVQAEDVMQVDFTPLLADCLARDFIKIAGHYPCLEIFPVYSWQSLAGKHIKDLEARWLMIRILRNGCHAEQRASLRADLVAHEDRLREHLVALAALAAGRFEESRQWVLQGSSFDERAASLAMELLEKHLPRPIARQVMPLLDLMTDKNRLRPKVLELYSSFHGDSAEVIHLLPNVSPAGREAIFQQGIQTLLGEVPS